MIKEQEQNKKAVGRQKTKDYTGDLPMHDLGTAIEFVAGIHEKALETASMPEVAKAFDYASPSSTPLYRRILAARLFHLMGEKVELTKNALDYLRPETEDSKSMALINAIQSIPAYDDLIQSHQGKRINLDIVSNGFMRKFPITKGCALLCARVFVSSIKFAGLMGPDGTLTSRFSAPKSDQAVKSTLVEATPSRGEAKEPAVIQGGYTLILDPKKDRKVVVQAPACVSESELKRIQAWLGFQLLVVPDGENALVDDKSTT